MKKLILTFLSLIITYTLYAQAYQGVFYVKSIYQDRYYCDKQFIAFAFRNDTVLFKIDGELHIFSNSSLVFENNTANDFSEQYYVSKKLNTLYNLKFFLFKETIRIDITNDMYIYPQFYINTKNFCISKP